MSSTGWTNNAALCIAKWYTSSFGMAMAWDELDEDSVIAAANICDERVLTQGSTTFSANATTDALTLAAGARVLDVGDGIRVSSSGTLPAGLATGTTYYVIPSDNGTIKLGGSVAGAFAEVAIDLITAGTGTHTLTYYDEARYKLNGSFALDARKGDVEKLLLSAMAGVAVYLGEKLFIYAGAAAIPIITLDEDDLRSDLTWIPKKSMRDRFNGVRGVYVNPAANWQPVDAPPLQSATYLAEDDGEELYEDLRFPFTTSTPCAQRLMKIALERNRRQGILHFPAKLTAMELQPWGGVFITNERYGWDQKQFRVIGWVLAEDGGIDLTLQEDDADVYAWDASEETAAAVQQGVVRPNPSEIAAPASIVVQTPATPTYTKLVAAWSEVGSIWLDGFDVEYRADGATDWTSYGRVGALASRFAQIESAVAIDCRVRSVTKNGTPSDWTTNSAPAALTSPSATGGAAQIVVDATTDVDTDEVQIFEHSANDFSASSLLTTIGAGDLPYTHSGLGSAETHYYWLRAVNVGDNISAPTASVNATTDP